VIESIKPERITASKLHLLSLDNYLCWLLWSLDVAKTGDLLGPELKGVEIHQNPRVKQSAEMSTSVLDC
jgi:hypothetical protein